MISAVVLTKNEEQNIGKCLSCLKWCDEILVIDDDSADKTVKIATEQGTKVIRHRLEGDFSFQRNFGLSQTKEDWVFFVDADERVSGELKEEILSSINTNENVNGFYFRRIDFFPNSPNMGKWLRHGEIGGVGGFGGVKILRLARRNAGVWVRRVDEKWEVKGKTKTLAHPLLHYPHPSLTEFLTSINERSTLNAQQLIKEGKRLNIFEWLKPKLKFFLNFFFRLGFLDGLHGFVFAVLMSFHSFLVRGKLYLLLGKDKKDKRDQREEIVQLLFLLWLVFVFLSYIFYLYQRGIKKW